MSNVSNRHTVELFESGKSEALSGQRLAKVGYKSTAKNPAKFPSICVSVPAIDTGYDFEQALGAGKFNAVIVEWLQGQQDSIVRTLYEAAGGKLSDVTDDQISIDACLNHYQTVQAGGRLTAEVLGNWFDSNVRDNLTVIVADKLGFDLSTQEQEDTVAKHVTVYRDILCLVAGNKTILEAKQRTAIDRMIELSGISAEDTMVKRIVEKVEEISRRKVSDILDI